MDDFEGVNCFDDNDSFFINSDYKSMTLIFFASQVPQWSQGARHIEVPGRTQNKISIFS